MCLMRTKGHWPALQAAWFSQLVLPGWLLHREQSPGTGWLAVQIYQSRSLSPSLQSQEGCRVHCTHRPRSAGQKTWTLSSSTTSVLGKFSHCAAWLHVMKSGKRVTECQALLLGRCPALEAGHLLHAALLHGFPTLSLQQLRRVTATVCAKPPGSAASSSSTGHSDAVPVGAFEEMTVRECVEALAAQQFSRSHSEQDVNDILTKRDSRATDTLLADAVVSDATLLMCESDESMDLAELEAVEQVTRDMVAARANRCIQQSAQSCARALLSRVLGDLMLFQSLPALPFRADSCL